MPREREESGMAQEEYSQQPTWGQTKLHLPSGAAVQSLCLLHGDVTHRTSQVGGGAAETKLALRASASAPTRVVSFFMVDLLSRGIGCGGLWGSTALDQGGDGAKIKGERLAAVWPSVSAFTHSQLQMKYQA